MVENIVTFRLLRLSAARSKSTEVENDTGIRNQGLDFCLDRHIGIESRYITEHELE